jgi:large subunit ribosomal protein L9
MKVILTRDVPNVGKDGEAVTVANGYARNYLFPRQLAIVAKGAAMKTHEARIAREAAKGAAMLSAAQQSAEKLRGKQFQIVGRAAPKSTRLFGSVTEADVAEKIQSEAGVTVDKRRISLIDPIKVTGVYELTARLHTDVTVPFSIEVVTPEQLDAREKARAAADEKAAKEAERLAAIEASKQAQDAAAPEGAAPTAAEVPDAETPATRSQDAEAEGDTAESVEAGEPVEA